MEYLYIIALILLVISVLYNLRQSKLIKFYKEKSKTITKNFFYDGTTDLPNRSNIEIIINENINIAKRRNKSFCILAIKNLDYRDFDDKTTGNSNELSLKITEGILSSIRDEDTVARVSKSEFIVVFNEYLEFENYDIPMDRISTALKGLNVRYSYVTFPNEAKSASELIDSVLAKL